MFNTNIVSCESQEDKFLVILGVSYFFPEAGGQPTDKGTIGDANIIKVLDTKPIQHLVDKKLEVGQEVKCSIDVDYRKENSRQHTGQHLLSAIALKMFGASSSSFKIAYPLSTIELDKKVSKEDVLKLELELNQQILSNHVVESMVIEERSEIPADLRKSYDFVPLRLVTIPDIDCCPCCGTHVGRTGEIGSARILSVEPLKNGTKLFFAFGLAALQLNVAKTQMVARLAESFTCGEEILEQNVANVRADLKVTAKKLGEYFKNMKAPWLEKAVKTVNGFQFVFTEFLTHSDAQGLLNELSKQNEKVLIAAVDGQETMVAMFSKAGDAEALGAKVAQSMGDKVVKNGGTAQRRVVLISKKLKEDDILKWVQ